MDAKCGKIPNRQADLQFKRLEFGSFKFVSNFGSRVSSFQASLAGLAPGGQLGCIIARDLSRHKALRDIAGFEIEVAID